MSVYGLPASGYRDYIKKGVIDNFYAAPKEIQDCYPYFISNDHLFAMDVGSIWHHISSTTGVLVSACRNNIALQQSTVSKTSLDALGTMLVCENCLFDGQSASDVDKFEAFDCLRKTCLNIKNKPSLSPYVNYQQACSLLFAIADMNFAAHGGASAKRQTLYFHEEKLFNEAFVLKSILVKKTNAVFLMDHLQKAALAAEIETSHRLRKEFLRASSFLLQNEVMAGRMFRTWIRQFQTPGKYSKYEKIAAALINAAVWNLDNDPALWLQSEPMIKKENCFSFKEQVLNEIKHAKNECLKDTFALWKSLFEKHLALLSTKPKNTLVAVDFKGMRHFKRALNMGTASLFCLPPVFEKGSLAFFKLDSFTAKWFVSEVADSTVRNLGLVRKSDTFDVWLDAFALADSLPTSALKAARLLK